MFSSSERKEDPECRISFPYVPFVFMQPLNDILGLIYNLVL